jgi:hypothetical protein
MFQFKGKTFYQLSRLLSALETYTSIAASGGSQLPDDVAPVEIVTTIHGTLRSYRARIEQAQLAFSLKGFDRFIESLATNTLTIRQVETQAKELQRRILDELDETNLWQVSKERTKFLNRDLFGFEQTGKFSDSWKDIEEAGKCLAFERGTASVFHLMRVMEVGLQALGKSLNDPTLDPKTNPSWEKILGRGDRELAKYLKDRTPEWQTNEEFFSTAHANLRAVKDGWRNKTIHVERNYDPEEAEEVWNAVKAFMRHLAQKLG